MTVKEFVDKYNVLTNEALKNKMVKTVVIHNYVPVLKKRALLEDMLQKSIVEDKNGTRYIDMFVSKINFTCVVLALYTNLDLSKKNDYDVYNDYDLLVSSNALSEIMKEINQDEINRLLSINEQIMDTFYNKEKTTEAYVNKVVTQFTTVFGSMCNSGLEQLIQLAENEEDKKNLSDLFKTVVMKLKK